MIEAKTSAVRRMTLAILGILVAASLVNAYFVPVAGRNMRPEHVAAPIAFLVVCAAHMIRREAPIRRDLFSMLAVAWVAVNALASWMFAPQPQESLVHVIRLGFLTAAFLAVANAPIRSTDWPRVFKIWLSLAIVALSYGIVVFILARYFGIQLPGTSHEQDLVGISIRGTQFERNLFGILAATVLAVSTYCLAGADSASRPAAAGWLIAGAIIGCTTVVLSLTRSAWLALFAAGPSVYLLLDRRRLSQVDRALVRTAVALPVALAMIVLATRVLAITYTTPTDADATSPVRHAVPGRPKSSPTGPASTAESPTNALQNRVSSLRNLDDDFTLSTRFQDAQWALADWRQSPWLGRGTGSFEQIHGSRRGSPAWISNLILHTLVDTGLVGLAIQLTFVCGIAWRGWRVSRQPETPVPIQRGLRALILGLVVMLIAYQSTDGTWLAVFWIHLGLIVSGIYVSERN